LPSSSGLDALDGDGAYSDDRGAGRRGAPTLRQRSIDMIAIVARLRIRDGKAEEFITAAREQIAAVRRHEAGKTLVYTLHRSTSDPNLFLFYERYADEAALAAHGTTEHMKVFGAKLRELLDGRPEIERCEILAELE
jgi:quinol monooxygenase YgiN